MFCSTWDYHERPLEFSAWLGRAERATRLCNPGSTIRWKADKHYLSDLADRGVPVVHSRFLQRGSTRTLAEVLEETGWDEAADDFAAVYEPDGK